MIVNQTIYKCLFLSVAIWLSTVQIVRAQQEAMYSQYMFNMLHINPAYAGNKEVDNLTFLFRHQWVGIPGAPKTLSMSWDRRSPDSNVGLGAQIYSDKIGVETTTGAQLFYSYHIPFNRASLSLGVSGGVIAYQAAYSESTPLESGDPMFLEDANGWLPSAGFGVLFSTENWYAGFSIPALLHTKVTVGNEKYNLGYDNHYFINGGYIMRLSSWLKLKPSFLFKLVRGAPVSTDYNLNAWFDDTLCVGFSYRSGDALVGMAELKIAPQVRIGYAYDHSISSLSNYNKGSHEIMLSYEFSRLKKAKIYSPRYY